MKQISILLLFTGLLLGSCSKDENGCQTDEVLAPVSFSPLMPDIQEISTRAVKTTWVEGDQIAIFSDIAVKKDGNTSTSSITYTRGATEGVWDSPNENDQWYFADAIRPHNFYAYYPVGSSTSYQATPIPDISGQDGTKSLTALKEENDFLRGAGTAYKGNIAASLQMFRVFAIVNLKVKLKQDAFANNAASLTEVKLISTGGLPLTNPSSSDVATVELSTGTVTCPNGLTTVTIHPASAFSLTPTEMSIPIKIFEHRSKIQVQFTVDGKTSVVQALSTNNFVGGHIYSYSVEIKSGLGQLGIGDPTIFDWLNTDGTPITPEVPD